MIQELTVNINTTQSLLNDLESSKQQQKVVVCDLQSENSKHKQDALSAFETIRSHEEKIKELSSEIKASQGDNNVIISQKNEISSLQKTVKAKDDKIQELTKKINTIQSLLNNSKSIEQKQRDKIKILEAVAGDVTENDVGVVIQRTAEEVTDSKAVITKLNKKYDAAVAEVSALRDKYKEMTEKFEKLDQFYLNVLKQKDETISEFTTIMKGEGNIEVNFKRLLTC